MFFNFNKNRIIEKDKRRGALKCYSFWDNVDEIKIFDGKTVVYDSHKNLSKMHTYHYFGFNQKQRNIFGVFLKAP